MAIINLGKVVGQIISGDINLFQRAVNGLLEFDFRNTFLKSNIKIRASIENGSVWTVLQTKWDAVNARYEGIISSTHVLRVISLSDTIELLGKNTTFFKNFGANKLLEITDDNNIGRFFFNIVKNRYEGYGSTGNQILGAGYVANGLLNITASRNLTVDDFGKILRVNSSSAITLTIPAGLGIYGMLGVNIVQIGAGQVTIATSGATTLESSETPTTRKQYSHITVYKINSNVVDTYAALGDFA